MLGEITTSDNRARALSIWAFAGNAGVLLAPIVGGLLANPLESKDTPFISFTLFQSYRYLLPSLVMGFLGLAGVLVCILFLEEVSQRKGDQETLVADDRRQTIPWDKKASQSVRIPSTREILSGRGVLYVLVNSLCANSMIYAWTAVQPVFSHTSIPLGGLGMTVQRISLLMAAVAIFQALASLIIFPALHKRLGTAGTLLFCGTCFFATFQISPLANLLARLGCDQAVWAVLVVACMTAALQTMASSRPYIK